ncbi:MAG: cytochrome c3 family protein [Planctomycetota bacterium]
MQITALSVSGALCLWIAPNDARSEPGSEPVVDVMKMDRGRPASCTTAECHAGVTRHRRVHRPVAQGRCLLCHVAREGATLYEAGVRHEFRRATDDPDACYACHENLTVEAHVHEPVRQGLCILCHDPHGARREFYLRVDTDRELCMQCHQETFTDGKHVHGPVARGACSACHDPHQSRHPYRLRSAGDLECGICHLPDMREIVATAHVHPPVAEQCRNCHEPHVGKRPFRLVEEPPRLCLDCHQDIESQIRHGVSQHDPVEKLECLDCHEPHGGDFRRALKGEFTGELYESFSLARYELCYRCHSPAQVTEQFTTDATGFRNGKLNLHFLHVNRSRHGRTCNFCHLVHSSPNGKLTRSRTEFGRWYIDVGLRTTETGGSCMPGCHESRSYDRVTPADNAKGRER